MRWRALGVIAEVSAQSRARASTLSDAAAVDAANAAAAAAAVPARGGDANGGSDSTPASAPGAARRVSSMRLLQMLGSGRSVGGGGGSGSGGSTSTSPPVTAPRNNPRESSSGGGLLRRFISKLTHPDAEIAHEGESMKAYYDKDKKCWVFPGEEAAPPPAPLGPPPTGLGSAAAPQPAPSAAAAAAAAVHNPLAALMAPPDPLATLMAPPSYSMGGRRGGRRAAVRHANYASFDLGLTVGYGLRRVVDDDESPQAVKRRKMEAARLSEAQTAVAALLKDSARFPGVGVNWREDGHYTYSDSGGWVNHVKDIAFVSLDRCSADSETILLGFGDWKPHFAVESARQCGLLLPPPPSESRLEEIRKRHGDNDSARNFLLMELEKGIPESLLQLRDRCQEHGWPEPAPHMIFHASEQGGWGV
ncbi:hypothetical protein JKP88DRAFT_292417 [Tribonema minus]|uniref:Uncharacterized protein n=1 Tax=Tribonema minus TaxID=303371 RepID=A0A835ZFG5_9STRA|nr:hypothetical protein JKP88DRAFT_292417 [Tribonema minus]